MKFTLFDADDLKMVEDMFAKAMTRAIVSALKIAAREGLLRPEHEPEPEPVHVAEPLAPAFAAPPPAASEPAPTPEPATERPVPVFLKPPPEHPFPNGKAVEPPELKHYAKTRKIYLELYKTVAERPHGYISVPEAANLLGGPSRSGQISTWLQKGDLEACIVANLKPSKGLPGRLMIKKESLIARDSQRRNYRK